MEDPRGRTGEFYYCSSASRQFVVVGTEAGTPGMPEEADPIARRQVAFHTEVSHEFHCHTTF